MNIIMAAPSSSFQAQDDPRATKISLLRKINELLDQADTLWQNILEKQQTCGNLVYERVETNQKFSDYHDLYEEIHSRWPTELLTLPSFLGMEDEVNELSNWMSDFERRAGDAFNTINELATLVLNKKTHLHSILTTLTNSDNESQLESIDLDNFTWTEPNFVWPNVDGLMEEWQDKNMFQKINYYVLEMTQLSNTPEIVLLSELEFMFDESSSPSSSSADSPGRIYNP